MADSLKQLRKELDLALDPKGQSFSLGKYAKTPPPPPLITAAPAPAPAPAPATAAPVYKSRAQLPVSAHLDTSNPLLPALYLTEPVALDLFDLRGLTIFADKSVSARITHSLLAPPPGRTNLYGQGQNDPTMAPDVAIEDCDIDVASPTVGYFNGVMVFSGSFAMRRNRLRNAPVTFVNFQSPAGAFTCEDNDFGSPGLNTLADLVTPANNSHAECVVIQAGRAGIRRNRFNPSDGVGRTKPATMTAQMLIQGQFGEVDAMIEGNDILGAASVLMPYAIQASAPKFATRLTLSGNRIEAGDVRASAYLAADAAVALTALGNTDAKTAASIDALLKA